MIKTVTRSYLINVFALWFVSQQIVGFVLQNGWKSLLIVALGLTLLHLVIKPIADLILGGVNFITLGVVGLLVDAAILYLLTLLPQASQFFPQVSITAWSFTGLTINGIVLPAYDFGIIGTTIVCAVVINLIRTIANLLT